MKLIPCLTGLLVVSGLLTTSNLGYAQDPDYVVAIPDYTVVGGQMTDVTLMVSNTGENLSGFSLGTCNDETLLQIIDIGFGADLQAMNGGAGPDFFGFAFFPYGFSCGTVFNFFGNEVLPPGLDYEAVVMTYETFPTPPTTTEIAFCDNIGSPPVAITVVTDTGQSVIPTTVDGLVEFVEGIPFVRGDTNASGDINLADPIVALAYLFQNGSVSCEATVDANGDGSAGLADALHLLFYINGLGPAPAAPFPECAADVGGGLECAGYSACP